MKGIIIYENPMWGDNEGATYCEFMNEASFELTHYAPKEVISCLKGEALESSKAVCSEDDTYDFMTGALIALMKMCGVEKVKKAAKETFFDVAENSVNEYEEKIKTLKEKFDKKVADLRDQIHENSRLIQTNGELKDKVKKLEEEKEQIIVSKSILYNKLIEENSNLSCIKSCNESTIESLEKTRDLLINKNNELIEENKELKLDCEKLCHGYVDTDMIFCGGRGTGKQYKALVELFKKIDQKKVDAAYKEAYNTTLPVWQKEFLKQAYEIHKESKEKAELPTTLDINGTIYRKSIQIKDFGEQINKLTVDSLIEESRAFTRKCVDEWLFKIPTKREEMWDKMFELHKESDVIIKVKKEDVNTFLHEIENKIPEITWLSTVKIFETKYTIGDIYEELKTHNRIYFRLSKKNKLSYSSDLNAYLFINLDIISYLPPMRWDLFEKGRLAVKVTYDNYKEFYEACEKELGKRPVTAVFTEDFKKDGLFEIFSIEDQKKTGRKIVDWEDVR